jgi:hypothetical protein
MGGAHGWEMPVRTRLVIPAALLIAAAYMKGRWDAHPLPGAAPEELAPPAGQAEAETAATALAPELAPAPAAPADALDLAGLAEWDASPARHPQPAALAADEPALERLSEWVAAPVAMPAAQHLVAVEIDESGRFLVGGWAADAGHAALCGLTFKERRADGLPIERIRLIVEAADNIAGDGPIVLGDPGFAPDREGFTLVVAAAGPGRFAAAGRYELLAA